MGYNQRKIKLLFENNNSVCTIEDALELLELKSLGYFHKFIQKEAYEHICDICDEHIRLHYYENLNDLENGVYDNLD
jgi:hypothetical protein